MNNDLRALKIAGFAKARAKHEDLTVSCTDRAVFMRVAMPDGTAFSAREDMPAGWAAAKVDDSLYGLAGSLLAQIYQQVFAAHRELVKDVRDAA